VGKGRVNREESLIGVDSYGPTSEFRNRAHGKKLERKNCLFKSSERGGIKRRAPEGQIIPARLF